MCTAVTVRRKFPVFGRTLDYECSFGEEVVLTPRNYALSFRNGTALPEHFSILGMAHIENGYPLYYDGVNEQGLAMAGLNFVKSASYGETRWNKDNVTQFEMILWILAQCASVREARALLGRMNVTGEVFSPKLPVARLHWLLADRDESVVVEPLREGLRVYEAPLGVLTNEPPFEQQRRNLCRYQLLTAAEPENRAFPGALPEPDSRGMGAVGLPGDLSSGSRFVRAAFTAVNALPGDSEEEAVTQLFHILETVSQTKGCCRLKNNEMDRTIYTGCCSLQTGTYFYTTYENRQITAVKMDGKNLDGQNLISYPLIIGQQFHEQVSGDTLGG